MKLFLLSMLIFLSTNCASSRVTNDIKLFDENAQICICTSQEFRKFSNYLAEKLETLIHKKIRIVSKCKSNEFCLELRKSSIQKNHFQLFTSNDGFIFQSNTDQGMLGAINYFLIHILGYIPYTHRKNLLEFSTKSIPKDFSYTAENPFFEYREPYFFENYKSDFKEIHQTDNLEDNWGLWGHGIPKKIKISPRMLAQTNGSINEEQLCFSSKELQTALSQYIKNSIADNPTATKFMIAPNDNVLACTCESCKNKGNSAKNASPAVYRLINELATQFPKLEFFGLAYHSSKKCPEYELKPNVGIMYSTIQWPKGVSLKESNMANQIHDELAAWKSKTNKIYLWEYAIHYDNYLNTFPTILCTKNNFIWLKELGITGVFLQGTEESYAAFSDLKAFVYAELMMNSNYKLHELIGVYFNNFYPKCARLLTNYYLQCEMFTTINKSKLDIYGGWKQDFKKYLKPHELWKICDSLLEIYPTCSSEEQENLNPILTALYFQKLEIMRTIGLLYDFNKKTENWHLKENVNQDFKNWQNFKNHISLKILNEAHVTVNQYEEYWKSILNTPAWKSLLAYSKPIFMSTPDEEYQDATILTDGAKGFIDYFNNWLLASKEPLKIKLPIEKPYSGTVKLEIGFLQLKRHKIYLPNSIRITLKNIEKELLLPIDHSDSTFNFSWEVKLNNEDFIEILVIKQDKYLNFATALDEIRLIPTK